MNIIEMNHTFPNRLQKRRTTKKLIIHHTASHDVDAHQIHGWHLDRGWNGIGYHLVIRMDGSVERGRPIDTVGAHAQGHNSDSIGIALTGMLQNTPPTEVQINALVDVTKDIFSQFGELEIGGHRDYGTTTCPGDMFPMEEYKGMVKSEVKVQINGRDVPISSRIVGGRTELLLDGKWVQMRALSELLGARLEWNGSTKTANMIVR